MKKKLVETIGLVLFAVTLASCTGALQGGTIGGSKPIQIPTYTFGLVACGNASEPCTQPIVGAQIGVNNGPAGTFVNYVTVPADRNGYALFTSVLPDSDVTVTAAGYQPFALGIQPPTLAGTNLILHLTPTRPPPPTRAALLAAPLTFQGLWLVCPDYPAGVPVFDVMFDVLSPSCQQAFYTMKRAAGDQVIALAVSHAYLEPGIPAPISTGHDWFDDPWSSTGDWPGLKTLIDQVIAQGFYVELHLAGDGSSSAALANGSWRYNDPVGWTYGQAWLMATFPGLHAGLAADDAYIRYVIGFDGVFYGWTPAEVVAFGQLFRSVCATCVLGIEHDAGHIPLGEGGGDYLPGGRMQDFDLVLGEFDASLRDDTTYQILGRMLPVYHRPPDQAASDDPTPPPYTAVPNPRGPWLYNCFEWNLYGWVRGQVTALQLAIDRLRLQTMGCTVVG